VTSQSAPEQSTIADQAAPSATHPDAQLSVAERAAAAGCPFHAGQPVTLPTDGTPLTPSPLFAQLRDEAPASPLRYADGHEGWLVTQYDMARAVLEDPRFSLMPHRFPMGPSEVPAPDVDDFALEAIANANLLSLDAPQHGKIRRSITSRFSVRSVKGYQDFVRDVVSKQLAHLVAQGSPVDLTTEYAQPISAALHCFVLGIPDRFAGRFGTLFVGESTTQQKFDFIRDVLAVKENDLGEDVFSDLLQSDLTRAEVEGVAIVLMSSGRDSVAYMIATNTVALLTHPEQLKALRENPALISTAIEEFMRFGSMFLTVFPRTATEDLTIEGIPISKGQTVSVSQVSANRDERRFEHADQYDVSRDAFGHLGFGHGQHGCVGQQLARAEIKEAITQLIQGIPSLYLVEAEQAEPMPFAHDVATYEAGSVIVGW
jgi:cytochrome P450